MRWPIPREEESFSKSYNRIERSAAPQSVQIFEYQVCLLHAKTMVVDGVWATIGSTNFDNRSFALNQEINLTVYDRAVATHLEEIFHQDLKYAKQVSYEEWKSRGIYERLVDLFAFPVKDQL